MTLARDTISYLEAMGIGVWESRQRPAASVADHNDDAANDSALLLSCLQAAAPPLACVVLQWPGPVQLDEGHPGGGLLLKILTALGQPLERFAIYQLREDLAAVPQLPPQSGRAVFQFVERPAAARGDVTSIALPTLERMLADPQAKRTAWERLRPWVQRLA